MDFYEVIDKRKSVRKYLPDEIPAESLERILSAVELAPSAKNLQPYNIVLVRDKEKIKRLAASTRNMTFMEEAPLVAVMVADPASAYTHLGGNESSFWVDAAIAMEHLVLAATNEGLATCWIGAFRENEAREVLKVPQERRIVGMTPIGFPAEMPERKPRKAIKELLFFEEWGKTG